MMEVFESCFLVGRSRFTAKVNAIYLSIKALF